MQNKGFTLIMIMFILLVLMALIGFLTVDNYFTNEANEELKQRLDLKSEDLRECQKPIDIDKRIFWHRNDAFIIKDYQAVKVLNINSLIQLISDGYVN